MIVPILVALLFVVAALGFVALPLVRRQEVVNGETLAIVDPALEELLFSREVTYAAIKDLAFEREMGKLSEEDYQQLDFQYRARAVNILQELEQVEQATSEDDDLEAWIEEAVRAARRQEDQADTVSQINVKPHRSGKRRPAAVSAECPSCERPYGPGDRFCSGCGAQLPPLCDACGATSRPETRFCTQCGAELPV